MADGIDRLSRERIGHEMRKLLRARPIPAPATAAMAQAGVLRHALPGADPAPLPLLTHAEADLAVAPTPAAALPPSAAPTRPRRCACRKAMRAGWPCCARPPPRPWAPGSLATARALPPPATSCCCGWPCCNNRWRNRSWRPRAPPTGLTLPVTPADLMALGLSGPALGDRLREIERRWIASGFTLSRADLLP